VAQSFRLLFKLRSRQSLASTIINDDSREVYAMSGLLKRAIATGNEDRHAKLAALGKSSFVSKSGIETLLKTVSDEGLPDAFSRASQYRARKAVCNTMTPYGTLVKRVEVKLADGTLQTVGVQSPLAMLYYQTLNSDHYSYMVRSALARHESSPSKPWNIILYQDGVDPSDGLAKNHSRKSCVFYWSFLEYGMAALAHEEAWGTPIMVRSTVVNGLEGNVTQLADIVLRQFFDPKGHDIRRAGVALRFPDGTSTTLFAKVGIIVADEPALKEIYSRKGHAGTKPCLLCMNVVLQKRPGGAPGLHIGSDYLVSIAESNSARFKIHTDDSLRLTVSKLNAWHGVLSQAAFEKKEQMYGFNYNAFSVIANERLRIDAVSVLMFDWAHCSVCDGVADGEFGELIRF
jgi:hypothetical protein